MKQTAEFLKVACQKCDTFVPDFHNFKAVHSKTITFEGLRAETIRFGGGDFFFFWATYQPGHLAATSYIHTWGHLQAYNIYRISDATNLQDLQELRCYKPTRFHSKASQPGGPVGAGGYIHMAHMAYARWLCIRSTSNRLFAMGQRTCPVSYTTWFWGSYHMLRRSLCGAPCFSWSISYMHMFPVVLWRNSDCRSSNKFANRCSVKWNDSELQSTYRPYDYESNSTYYITTSSLHHREHRHLHRHDHPLYPDHRHYNHRHHSHHRQINST